MIIPCPLPRVIPTPVPAWYRAVFGGPSLDADTVAFRTASGATDVSGIDAIASYMRAQGLRDNYRFYPKKSAQNAGSGSTVYGIGGLTANHMTLVNSPTWGVNGITYAAASSHHGRIADFIGAETLTVFTRTAELDTSSTDREIISQGNTIDNQRSWRLRHDGAVTGSPYKLLRFSDGTTSNFESFETGEVSSTAERLYVAQWIDGGGRHLWINKTPQSLSLTGGTAQTARHDSTADIVVNGILVSNSPTNFNNQTMRACLFVTGTLTTEQRETLTDLVNAL